MNKREVSIIGPLMLGTFMAALDNSIVNISLPVMQEQFGVAVDDIQWVVSAYMLAFCVFMPLTNWLKEKVGLYKVYIAGIIVFAAGSLCSGLSSGLSTILPSRILQALGGGSLTPVALAMLSMAFGEKERGRVMGWWGLGVVVGPALGPTLGGIITQYLGWPYIFFINLPFAVLALILSMRNLKELGRKRGEAAKFDLSGYIFFILFIVLLQFSVARVERTGFMSPWFYLPFSVLAIWPALRLERKRACRTTNGAWR